jgi:hypothetical protein
MPNITIDQFNNKKASEVYENYIFIYQFQVLPLDTVEVTIDGEEINTPSNKKPFNKLLNLILNCDQNILLTKKNCN